MSLKEELFNAAKPFLKEGLDSSKEIIAANSTSFDEMGMANSKPGEFSPEEITDLENLVNVSKMSNDTDFSGKDDQESETVVSILGIEDTPMELADLVNLGTGSSCDCEDDMCSKECHPQHHHALANVIESILRYILFISVRALRTSDMIPPSLPSVTSRENVCVPFSR